MVGKRKKKDFYSYPTNRGAEKCHSTIPILKSTIKQHNHTLYLVRETNKKGTAANSVRTNHTTTAAKCKPACVPKCVIRALAGRKARFLLQTKALKNASNLRASRDMHAAVFCGKCHDTIASLPRVATVHPSAPAKPTTNRRTFPSPPPSSDGRCEHIFFSFHPTLSEAQNRNQTR